MPRPPAFWTMACSFPYPPPGSGAGPYTPGGVRPYRRSRRRGGPPVSVAASLPGSVDDVLAPHAMAAVALTNKSAARESGLPNEPRGPASAPTVTAAPQKGHAASSARMWLEDSVIERLARRGQNGDDPLRVARFCPFRTRGDDRTDCSLVCRKGRRRVHVQPAVHCSA
jgi:hypothetical protein